MPACLLSSLFRRSLTEALCVLHVGSQVHIRIQAPHHVSCARSRKLREWTQGQRCTFVTLHFESSSTLSHKDSLAGCHAAILLASLRAPQALFPNLDCVSTWKAKQPQSLKVAKNQKKVVPNHELLAFQVGRTKLPLRGCPLLINGVQE